MAIDKEYWQESARILKDWITKEERFKEHYPTTHTHRWRVISYELAPRVIVQCIECLTIGRYNSTTGNVEIRQASKPERMHVDLRPGSEYELVEFDAPYIGDSPGTPINLTYRKKPINYTQATIEWIEYLLDEIALREERELLRGIGKTDYQYSYRNSQTGQTTPIRAETSRTYQHIPATHRIEDCVCGGLWKDNLPRLDIVCPACDGKVSRVLPDSVKNEENRIENDSLAKFPFE